MIILRLISGLGKQLFQSGLGPAMALIQHYFRSNSIVSTCDMHTRAYRALEHCDPFDIAATEKQHASSLGFWRPMDG